MKLATRKISYHTITDKRLKSVLAVFILTACIRFQTFIFVTKMTPFSIITGLVVVTRVQIFTFIYIDTFTLKNKFNFNSKIILKFQTSIRFQKSLIASTVNNPIIFLANCRNFINFPVRLFFW